MHKSISFSCKNLEIASKLIANNQIADNYWNKHSTQDNEIYFKCSSSTKCPAKLKVFHHDLSERVTIFSFDKHDHTEEINTSNATDIQVLFLPHGMIKPCFLIDG